MPADRPPVAKPKSPQRSRVGNGSIVLPDVDGRSPLARRVRELLGQFVTDMGGNPSEAQLAIAKRASVMVAWCESQEAGFVNGEEFDVATYGTTVNALRRLLVDIGLQRHARDITPAASMRDELMRGRA